jgi:hypothetical protein
MTRSYVDLGLDAITFTTSVLHMGAVGESPLGTTFQARTSDGVKYGSLIDDNRIKLGNEIADHVAWRASPVTQDELDEAKGGFIAKMTDNAQYDMLKRLQQKQAGKDKATLKAEEAFVEQWNDWKDYWDAFYKRTVKGYWADSMFGSMTEKEWQQLEKDELTLQGWGKKYKELGYGGLGALPTLAKVRKDEAADKPETPTPPWLRWVVGSAVAVSLAVIVVKVAPYYQKAPAPPPQPHPERP